MGIKTKNIFLLFLIAAVLAVSFEIARFVFAIDARLGVALTPFILSVGAFTSFSLMLLLYIRKPRRSCG